jgi:hypothetical protein
MTRNVYFSPKLICNTQTFSTDATTSVRKIAGSNPKSVKVLYPFNSRLCVL